MDKVYTLNDYELLYMIRTGDSMAYQMLLEKYEHYILVLLDRFVRNSDIDVRDDLKQECQILFTELCMSFRDDQQCRFLTYLSNGILNCMRSIQRKEQRKMKNIKLISLDSCVNEEGSNIRYGDYLDSGYRFFQPEYQWRYADSVNHLKNLLQTLTDKEKAVWKLMNEEVSYEQAAEIMGISRKQFDNLRLRLKKKIVLCIMKPDKIKKHH